MMEQNFQGDLTDILRASGSGSNNNNSYEELLEPNSQNWHFTSGDDDHHHHHHHHQNQTNVFSSLLEDQASHDTFGDPFSDMNDPLIIATSNINNDGIPAGPAFFGGSEPSSAAAATAAGEGFYPHQDVSKFRPSCNVFSRILQINPSSAGGVSSSTCSSSSNAKPEATAAAVAVARCSSPRGLMMSGNAGEGGVDGAMSGGGGGGVGGAGGLQISSPRNPGAIKRRKSQAKKVVCIPAPAAANSRASGEVVPSDLWAWRKYGQKPIKGSPYPRGYYRCSSSKGCSARKQVERSRTDPNMLVITYTSEHNHPWPTQRNALAGSTRSQPSKPNNNNNNSGSKSPQMVTAQPHPASSSKEEQKSEILMSNAASRSSPSVKEENFDQDNSNNSNKSNISSEKRLESSDNGAFSGCIGSAAPHEVEFGYRPQIMSSVGDQDFFAELGEIEADPLNLLFSQSISSSTEVQNRHKELVTGNNGSKGLLENPFSLFDWSESNNSSNNTKQRE